MSFDFLATYLQRPMQMAAGDAKLTEAPPPSTGEVYSTLTQVLYIPRGKPNINVVMPDAAST